MHEHSAPESVSLLKAEVYRFRHAIDQYVEREPHPFLTQFPAGCCKHASLLLARYFGEMQRMKPELIANGRRINEEGHRESHAWLELDGIVIDITADQFGKDIDKVIVTPCSAFHDGFEDQSRFPYDTLFRFKPEHRLAHDQMYAGILECLDIDEHGVT